MLKNTIYISIILFYNITRNDIACDLTCFKMTITFENKEGLFMKLTKVFVAFFSFLFLFTNPNKNKCAVAAEAIHHNETYIVNSFLDVPTDWVMNTSCDHSHASVQVDNQELVVTHQGTNGSASNFYGAMMTIADGYTFENFTFTMRFKMTQAENSSRWFGIAYHTQGKDAAMKGYLMNYRQSGESAASAFVKGAFKDEAKVATGVPLNDNQYHTLEIVMEGNQARHYIDHHIITSWDVNIKNSDPLGTNEYLKEGGFSLIVNRSTICIASVEIVPEAKPQLDDEKKIDEELVNTYRWSTNLINFPTVITKIHSAADLEKLSTEIVKPSNVILRMNEDAEIVGQNGEVIAPFYDVYRNNLKKEVIPLVQVETQKEADALSTFLKDRIDILDMAVLSSNATYIKNVRQNNTKIRGVLLANETNTDMFDLVKKAQGCGSTTIILPSSLASIKNVTYLQARFKSAWVMAMNASDFDLYHLIHSGASGMVVSNYAHLYELYATYDQDATTRAGFNVAHRGLTNGYNENSLSGMKAAIEKGATHLEIDCYLTVDQEIVIMHDGDISRTTNGEGNIESYTLEQLRAFKLDVYEPLEDIPTLDDVISLVKNTDVVIVLEVKSAKTAIVSRIKEKLTQYDCFDQVIAISFNRDILGKIKADIPEMPIAFLGAVNQSNIKDKLKEMGQYHYVFDTEYSNTSREFNEYYLRDRGITGWYWTFDNTAKTELVAIANGYVGITNNVGERFAKKVKYIEGMPYELKKGEDFTSFVNLEIQVHYYDGTIETLKGDIFQYREQGDHYDVICKLEVDATIQGGRVQTFYTQAFSVTKYVEQIEPPISTGDTPTSSEGDVTSSSQTTTSNKGCGKAATNLLCLLSFIAIIGIVIKKK